MDDYKSNSHRSREEIPEKRVEKIVTGPVKARKKGEVQRFADVFISEDVKNVKSYILMDVLVPSIKKAISDIFHNGIDMILYGESGAPRSTSAASRVSYQSMYNQSSIRDDRTRASVLRTGYDYDDVILNSRGEAEDVLSRMDELIAAYGLVSVADLYDLVGITRNYTDNKYGWTNIRNAEIVRLRDGGYMIKMPKALPLN